MNVQEKVIAILEEQLGLPKGEISLESTKESLGMDSLDEVETIMALEEEFDIEINDYQAEKFKSVRDVVDFIKATQLCNTMSKEAYNDAKEVFSEVYKDKSLHDIVDDKEGYEEGYKEFVQKYNRIYKSLSKQQPYQVTTGEVIETVVPLTKFDKITGTLDLGDEYHEVEEYPLSYTKEQLQGKDLVAHKDGYTDEDKSLFCKKGKTYKIDILSEEELSFINEDGYLHYWNLYNIGEYFYPIDKIEENPYNPVKDISYKKYLRCAGRVPDKMFNSDKGCLWMYKSSCGKYYYWEEYNCASKIIYRRGEVDWVESNYEEYSVEDEFSKMVNSLDHTKRVKLEGTVEEKKSTLLNDLTQSTLKPTKGDTLNSKTEWTDKHYDFNYTLTEDDIEKGLIKIDPYFVNRMWRINSWDDTGAAFHCLKNFARISNGKNPLERDLRSQYKQIKRLCDLHGVDLI